SVVPDAVAGAGAKYVAADHLGSPRAVTNSGGAVVSRHDYKPFGEEVAAGVGGRTAAMGYSQLDGVRQKFTGSERDAETGLDFMQARYYASSQGRFTSTDPYDINMERQYEEDDRVANELLKRYILKPVRWNRYAYVLNNPLRYVDPTGEKEEEIRARVNIVYDKETIKTEEAAKKLTAATVADAVKVYAAAGIKLEVTYTAGAATGGGKIEAGNSITEGKVDGAVNIFVSENRNQYTGGVSNPNTGESFINYGAGSGGHARNPDDGILAHELGHQFGVSSKASRLGSLGDLLNNMSDDSVIDSANASLRKGVRTEYVPPINLMGGLDNSAARGYHREIPTIATYRNGARRFSRH
nr:RHS repeat-associated core domain-containing protein [Acidobacteriota bacterium]